MTQAYLLEEIRDEHHDQKGGIRARTSGWVSKIGTCGDAELATEKARAGKAQRGIFVSHFRDVGERGAH